MTQQQQQQLRKEEIMRQEAHRLELEIEREIAEVEAMEEVVTNRRYRMYED